VPDLVDASGRFRPGHFRTGLARFFRPAVRRQLAAEIEAQFEAFRRTGLALDHVNVHHHLQLHPTVLGLILRLGPRHGLRAARLPREPWRTLWRTAEGGPAGRVLPALLLAPWAALVRLRLARAGLACNDHLLGMADYGRLDGPRLLRLLDNLPEGVTEIHFHPSTDAGLSGRADRELAGLTSPAVAARLGEPDLASVTFADLVSPRAAPSRPAVRPVPDAPGRRNR
jgi:hopanoid biosynthesis associated protein HpnK